MTPPEAPADRQRLDKWLWFARVVRTRRHAQEMAVSGHVRLGGKRVESASQMVRAGDVLTIALEDRVRVLEVTGFAPAAATPRPPPCSIATSARRPRPAAIEGRAATCAAAAARIERDGVLRPRRRCSQLSIFPRVPSTMRGLAFRPDTSPRPPRQG